MLTFLFGDRWIDDGVEPHDEAGGVCFPHDESTPRFWESKRAKNTFRLFRAPRLELLLVFLRVLSVLSVDLDSSPTYPSCH